MIVQFHVLRDVFNETKLAEQSFLVGKKLFQVVVTSAYRSWKLKKWFIKKCLCPIIYNYFTNKSCQKTNYCKKSYLYFLYFTTIEQGDVKKF